MNQHIKRNPNGALVSVDEIQYKRRLAQKQVDKRLASLEDDVAKLCDTVKHLSEMIKIKDNEHGKTD